MPVGLILQAIEKAKYKSIYEISYEFTRLLKNQLIFKQVMESELCQKMIMKLRDIMGMSYTIIGVLLK